MKPLAYPANYASLEVGSTTHMESSVASVKTKRCLSRMEQPVQTVLEQSFGSDGSPLETIPASSSHSGTLVTIRF